MTTQTDLLKQALDALKDIHHKSNALDPTNYIIDDRDGCIDAIFAASCNAIKAIEAAQAQPPNQGDTHHWPQQGDTTWPAQPVGVPTGQVRIDKLLDLVHVMRTELVKNNIELEDGLKDRVALAMQVEDLRKELGNLPEAQAEMLSTIKELRNKIKEMEEPDCRTCKNYLDCSESYNWSMHCINFSQYKRVAYTPLCEITS